MEGCASDIKTGESVCGVAFPGTFEKQRLQMRNAPAVAWLWRGKECGVVSGTVERADAGCGIGRDPRMSESPHVVSYQILKLCCAAMLVAAGVLQGRAAGLGTNGFGFLGPEIFLIENQISQLRVA